MTTQPLNTVEIYCTKILDTQSGFAVRMDTGEQVFIPGSVTASANLEEHSTRVAVLAPNAVNADKTPWFALRIMPANVTETPNETTSIDDRIKEYIHQRSKDFEQTYWTTNEISDAMGVDTKTAGNALTRLFNTGKIAKADVYSAPGLQRPSFCLWAMSAASFVE